MKHTASGKDGVSRMAGVVLAGLMLVVATGATHAPVTAIATGGAGGDAAVVLDDTTMWREFQVAGASHERDADGKLVRCAVYPNIATAEAKGPALWNYYGSDDLGVKRGTMETFWSALPPAD